jgi:magnesium-protoporphyrin O-methyltransferase
MMSPSHFPGYAAQRERLEHYFDRTARDAWAQLTSTAPVGRVRATVRAGRDSMRATILGWLPSDLRGARLLDAGCGTGALTIEAAGRGAHVTAVDVAGGLIDVARERAPRGPHMGPIDWRVADMADPELGEFDHVVAMDSLIHYRVDAIAAVVAAMAERTRKSIVMTFAPRTPALAAMHAVGRLFPNAKRAPGLEPMAEAALRGALSTVRGWEIGRTQRISSGFYTSQALELVRQG